MPEVIVAGAGPTGIFLASELRLHGVDVVVLDKEPEPNTVIRALGLHSRSIEIMDQRGLGEHFAAAGTRYPLDGFFAGILRRTPGPLPGRLRRRPQHSPVPGRHWVSGRAEPAGIPAGRS